LVLQKHPPAPAEASSRDIVEAAAVGIIALDAGARILSANAAAIEMLRCSEAELVGLGAHEALNEQRPAHECELEDAVRTGRASHFEVDTFRTRTGHPLPVWWAVNPLRDPDDGTVAGAVLVFGDSTNQRAQAVADAEEREAGRVELAEAHQSIADLEWAESVSQAMSSTLDEVEVMQRLARLVVPRLADLALGDLILDDMLYRAGHAVAEHIDIDFDFDFDEVLAREDVAAPFEPQSASYRIVTSTDRVEITGDGLADPALLSPPTRAMLEAVGASALLAVPLIARGNVVGALGLIRLADSPPFSDIDKLAASDVSVRAALAVDNARLYRAQTDIATRLQRALLPDIPKDIDVRVAVRYLPARDRFDVGGDWYDVFRLPGEKTALVVGDVAGHDLVAGTTMSALRNLLRGVSVVTTAPPAEVLRSIDENLQTLAIQGTATVLMATVEPRDDDSWTLRWSNAGHMPMLLLTKGGEVELLNDIHGPLLGTGHPLTRSESELVVAAGSTLVLYTDGLVETREETIDTGLVRLRRSAISLAAPLDDPEAIADEVLARNHASVEDDTAMLVCHFPHVTRR
jgi:PAS domain S-box-containing protein